MRKTFRARRWLAALLTLALVVSLAPAAAAAFTVSLSENVLTCSVGDTNSLTLLRSDGGTFTTIPTWSSSDENVVKIETTATNTATIKAVGCGKATITAVVGKNGDYKASCEVTVVTPTVTITSDGSGQCRIGDERLLTARLDNGPTGGVTWNWTIETTNSQVAAFKVGTTQNAQSATIIAVGGGSTTVKATASKDGKEIASNTYNVSVEPIRFEITSDPADPNTLDVGVAKEYNVKITNYFQGRGEKFNKVAWEITHTDKIDQVVNTSDEQDEKQFIFTMSAAEQTKLEQKLTVTYKYTVNGVASTTYTATTDTVYININYPEITMDPNPITMTVGEQKDLQVTLGGKVSTAGTWDFGISGTAIGTGGFLEVVGTPDTTNGKITVRAIRPGNTTIPVSYTVGGKNLVGPKACEVNIAPYVAPQIAPIQDIEMVEGDTVDVTAALTPANMKGTWAWTEPTTPVAEGKGKITIDDITKQTCKIKAGTLEGQSTSEPQTVKVRFTIDKTSVTLPAGAAEYVEKTFNVTVKQADRKVEIDPAEKELNILQDTSTNVQVKVTKGGIALTDSAQNKTITFNPNLTDSAGRLVARVTEVGNVTVPDADIKNGSHTATLTNGTANLTIKPRETGEATLTVNHLYGGTGDADSVKQAASGTFKIKVTGPSIKLDKTKLELDLVGNQNGELTATLEPSGTLANVKWYACKDDGNGDPDKDGQGNYVLSDVISITHDRTGHCLVRAEKNGTAIIVATYELSGDTSGLIKAECEVEVGEYHFSISPDTDQRREPGETVSIQATISRSGKTASEVMAGQEKNIRWQISDGTVARFKGMPVNVLQVSGKQSVTVEGRDKNSTGTVTVTATWEYTDKKGEHFKEERSIDITFAAPEAKSFSFTLPRSTVTGDTGGDLTQTPTTGKIKWEPDKNYPVPGDFKPTYTYQSSDTKVAKVENGKVIGVGAGEATITVTGSATANGKAITAEPKTYKVVVSEDLSVKSIKLSANSLSLDVGGRQTVTATTDPAGANVVWSSSNDKIVTVNAGTIVAVGPGVATVTAAAGGQTAQVQVTVNGLEQLLDEVTVAEGKTVSVDTIFKAHGTAAGKNPTYSSLDPTVASYANGAIVGNKVGSTSITIASGTYRISVKVTVVADSTSIIDLPTMYTQTQPILRFRDFIARFRPQAGGDLSHIVGLNVDTSKGTLYYNYTSASEPGAGVGADSYYISPAAGQRGIEDITFVPKPGYSGRVTINYTAVSKGGQNFVCSIVFDVDTGSGSGSGLNLSTPYNTPLRFSGAEFNRVCQDRLGVRLDYVTFSQPSSQQGTLYTNYVSAGNYGKVVSGSDQYTTKALDDVWFVPAPGFSGSVTVYYTAYGVGGASYSGQASISVGWENNVAIGGLTYDINQGGVAYFDDFRFSSYCRQVLDSSKNLSHIRISSLPASNEGVLYYNYNSSSRTQASTGTNYYYNSSSPYIDRLAFAAASGFTGTVKIPFTGWTTDGVSFTGNVEINVQSGGGSGSAGDIVYICGAGQTVSFDDRDFNDLSRTRTGSGLNYITLESLPGSASGSIYYNNTRASTGTNYRNGSSTPRIDNLSFRASSGFYGAVDIPFTGRSTNGETFRGVITVASSSSAVGSGGSNASQTVFTDMAGYSAAQQAAVNYLYDHNITRGMTTTQYGPQSSIRRGDFARMVYLAFDLTPSASSRPFQDVPSTAYYAQAVNALYSRGIVSGIGGGLYDPNGTLTRQDAVCMVQRAMRAVGWSADDGSVNSLYRYSDGGSVSGYAQGAMAFAVDRGILPTGGSWLNPTQPLSRVDMAEILYRVLANSGY